jgi:hypothetical protein
MPALTYSGALTKAYKLGKAAKEIDTGYGEHCPYVSADLVAAWRRGYEGRPGQDSRITED